MMSAKTKSIEKIAKASDGPVQERSSAPHKVPASPQNGLGFVGVQQAAGNLAVQNLFRAGLIQAKLSVSQPGDPDEQEADRIAERVVSPASAGLIQRKCAPCAEGATCPKCEEEEEKVQTKEKPGHTPQVDSKAASQIASLRGGGQPLAPSVRAFFEPRFGRDFSGVRVHTDGQAAESARAIQARAFTAGQDVVFGAGEFAPETQEGRRLLTHELTHVVQQAGGGGSNGAVQCLVPAGMVVQPNSAVQDAIDSGDTAKINALHHSALQLATPDQKIALIRIIVEKGGATHWLELLWNGVKDPVVEANIDLWRTTWEKYAGVMREHSRKTQFTRDVADLANAMLTESEALCDAYLQYYGLSPDAKKPGQNTPERDQSISAVQQKVVEVMGAQTQLKQLWTIKIPTDPLYLGSWSTIQGSYPFELDVQPIYASSEGMELWKKTNASVKELTSSIDSYLEAFPELYPLVMSGKSSKRDAYSDLTSTNLAATKPLDAIEQGLRQTIDNIKAIKGPMVETLARERKLGPVEQQLLSGAKTAPGNQNRNWKSSPIWSAMVPAITAKSGFVTPEGALMLGMQIAIAVTTGGIGNVLLSGGQAVLSHAEAGVLQTASDTSLSAKNAIMSKQEVAMAKLAAAVDAAFLVFDLVPGVKQARGMWSAARGSAHIVEKAAADLEKKVLQYEAKLMQKAEKAELEAIQKSMQQQADAAGKALQDAKTATANASGTERTLAEAEVRKAEEALVKAQTSLRATEALCAGEALVVELGGRHFSWVPGRGMVICASPCAAAVDWLDHYGLELVKEARAHSQLAGDAVEKRLKSARQHLADLDQVLKTHPPDKTAFDRATVHANSIIEEVKAQQRFAMLRYPLGSGAPAAALGNKEWAEAIMKELRLRKQAIEDVDKAFYGSLTDPNVKTAALAAHASEWESKLGKVRDPSKPTEKLGSLTQALEEHGKNATVDPNQRAILMQNIDTALTNYERELRGQRDLVLSGAELKAFTDEAAGKLLYPGLTARELRDAKKPDYIAELGNKLIIGDSKGAGDVTKSVAQIKPALDTDYVKNAVAAGKTVECRVYLDAADAEARGYRAIGHPPVLNQLVDGKYQPLMVTDKLPLYVIFN